VGGVSPKSHGRPSGRNRARASGRRPQLPRASEQADLALRSAQQERLADLPATAVEAWASGWLGLAAPDEQQFCQEVARRAGSAVGLAALAALRRVAAPSAVLDEAVQVHAAKYPLPAWHQEPRPEPTGAWRAVDVWDSERVLFLDYADHTLLAHLTTGFGVLVETLVLLEPGAVARWESVRRPEQPPMPMAPAPVADVLRDLAEAMQRTDHARPPRLHGEGYVRFRALARSRCRSAFPRQPAVGQVLRDVAEEQRRREAQRADLLRHFLAVPHRHDVDPDVRASAADVILDYGEERIPGGPLAWSPAQVDLFLTFWLPREAELDAEQRSALPDVLRDWLDFALRRRGVDAQWILPVMDAVDEFEEAHAAPRLA
jgi:hypothetical protein